MEACPANARYLKSIPAGRKKISVSIDGRSYQFSNYMTILNALLDIGYEVSYFPGEGQIYAPCRTGGCWSCSVLVNNELKPSCTTPIQDGMEIETDHKLIEEKPPLRLIGDIKPHPIGGVGTPYQLRRKQMVASFPFTELVVYTQGCILRCPTCQNWPITYGSRGSPLTPEQAASRIHSEIKSRGMERITISGGESTINRRWLISLLKSLAERVSQKVHLHVDTNGCLLTPGYIDELVDSGMTDIGVDIKALRLETFKKITGLGSDEFALRLLKQTWDGIEYMARRYRETLFIGIGVIYNTSLITGEEIMEIGRRLALINPGLQITLLDYSPQFRRRDIRRPSPGEMIDIWKLLKETGLECVTCQTLAGFYGP